MTIAPQRSQRNDPLGVTCRKLTAGVSGAPFEYEYHFIEYEYEYEHFWAIRGIIAGNH
jgi:hypothetical protein